MKVYCAIDDDHEVPGVLFVTSSEEKFKKLKKRMENSISENENRDGYSWIGYNWINHMKMFELKLKHENDFIFYSKNNCIDIYNKNVNFNSLNIINIDSKKIYLSNNNSFLNDVKKKIVSNIIYRSKFITPEANSLEECLKLSSFIVAHKVLNDKIQWALIFKRQPNHTKFPIHWFD